ncbi:ATP-dependent helicase rhp16 isoform X3 [Durio zibethinus]|uniref:ATP-dependent helicase rhp16 isoform X3 n=1 Tax=Durio zibethinus TaxID=66656 RepID=A0A6P6BIZ2_DURZI|nr:ATP-dependent helicase rhp16 isoform X3 [Durio zibethinus]
MNLRSRKRISNPSNNEEHSDSSDKGDDFIQLDDLSDVEIYVPPSDSDQGEGEILDLNQKPMTATAVSHLTRAPITISDFAEPSPNRANGEQKSSEQNEFHCDIYVSNRKKRNNVKKKKKKTRAGPPLRWEDWEQEHEKWIDDNLTADIDLDQQNAVIAETFEASSELIIPLLRYQKEWLAWALKQEDSATKGGILADEMGMGKTIQAIALVLAKREILHAIEPDGSLLTPGSSTDLAMIKGTLVICPVVAVSQWAHFVKDRRCNTAKAVLTLESLYKWALSGTPLQNRVGELYSLVRFLQIVPYSYYLCKDCDCRTLDYSSSTQCSNCPHNSVRHFCWWNKYVATPIQQYGNGEIGKRAMILLKHKILKNIVLRRTKKGRAADLALPPRIISLRRDTMDIKETDYYESLYSESQAQFNTYVQAGTVMNNYAHIFDLLTRLRQAVDHPYLVVYSSTTQRAGNIINCDKNNDEQACGICHEPAEDPVVTACSHVFCKACLIDFSASLGQVSCPSCSRLLTVDLTTNADAVGQSSRTTLKGFKPSSILNRIQLNDFQTSTKIEALREEIRFMVERDGSAKAIVFSQFTSFLDLINYSLHQSGINCVQLVGSMSMAARDYAIKRFTEDPDCKIFLMSLKAGGVALNLTVASHVFLMDPWWNPAVERQAQDRIHRIGQCKPIRVVRFVIENTIEERILKLQEKKELVFEGTVGGSSEALGKLTEADMRFLFVT